MKYTLLFFLFTFSCTLAAQDLSLGLVADDLSPHPMQELAKPGYLETVIDPSFGTTIRRISDAGEGVTIRSMYSTVQAWNADESRLILYKRPGGAHILLDGFTYEYIRDLDISPADIEEVFWHFEDPNLLYYLEKNTSNLIEYNVSTDSKNSLVNLRDLTGCTEGMESGNDVQMMSWDSDVFSFRCGNIATYAYQISTSTLLTFEVADLQYTAINAFPSGGSFLHGKDVYDAAGAYSLSLDISSGNEHSCIGRDSEGNDYYFSVAFAESPSGGCLGEVIGYDPKTGECRTIVGTELGYNYTQSGTHISSLAHKNTEGGWLVASMMGYDKDGQSLLDQELIIAQVKESQSTVYRIAHHRSDEDEFDYWGEPHPVLSPTGTRVLFNSDWSGDEDGLSVDAYVVELPAYSVVTAANEELSEDSKIALSPNPTSGLLMLETNCNINSVTVYDLYGNIRLEFSEVNNSQVDISSLHSGVYLLNAKCDGTETGSLLKVVKM